MNFSPDLIKNKIVPGNIYRTWGSVHGWDDCEEDSLEYVIVYEWGGFMKEAARRGISDDVMDIIYNRYRSNSKFVAMSVDIEDLSFQTYDEFGQVPDNPDSKWRLITGPDF